MTSHDSGHPGLPDLSEAAALYAAGAMTAAEALDFESRLAAAGDPAGAEFAALAPVVAELIHAVEPVEPSAAVREALLRRIAEAGESAEDGAAAHDERQVWKRWDADASATHLLIRNAMKTGWEETGISGIAVRRLSVDRQRNQTTMLVRMAAGTGYPSHIHDGPEECLVLEGDLRVGDEHHLRAGDFQRMAPGSRHGYQSTDGGCLLLIVSSLSDKLD
ncbi:MAG: cupin domain-containing protein [Phycisphaerales bacterium]|nr:MAG: cupin domain-containing protein [Phycisphaerales bacterium]